MSVGQLIVSVIIRDQQKEPKRFSSGNALGLGTNSEELIMLFMLKSENTLEPLIENQISATHICRTSKADHRNEF